ncbi:MAG: 3D domain-containing protein [Candidatus Hydrogenedentes bacterium]|nr:3D domain-containing protein [Candidatus Hydrogenedentota bacterium]
MRRLLAALFLIAALVCTGCATARIAPPRGASAFERVLLTTGYCKCKQCCGWKRNWRFKAVVAQGRDKGKPKRVGVTASGTKARPGTIAADTSVYPFGTVMFIPGYGYGRVEDRGGAIKGEHIDLFFKKHKQALAWGRQDKRVKVWLPR